MKLRSSKLTRMFILLGAIVATTVPEAFAASAMKAHVPFAFVVGNRVMPAGDYTVGNSASGSAVLYVRGGGAGIAVISSPSMLPAADAVSTALVFQTRGSQRYLVGVKWSDEPSRSIPAPSFKEATLTATR
jgi:hypothetical protein